MAAIVSLVLVSGFKHGIINDPSLDPVHVDYCWRLLIGLGCASASIALYFRLTLPETPRFTMDVERNIELATKNVDAFVANRAHGVQHDLDTDQASGKATLRD